MKPLKNAKKKERLFSKSYFRARRIAAKNRARTFTAKRHAWEIEHLYLSNIANYLIIFIPVVIGVFYLLKRGGII